MTLAAAAALTASGVPGSHPSVDQIQYTCYANIPTENKWFCAAYLHDYRPQLVDATIQHLEITVLAVLAAVVVAFPVALLARRLPWLESSVLAVTTGIYTIPSIALIPLLVPFLGITRTTVVVALALYGLTVLVRSILEGLHAVPDDVRESARGLGFGPGRMLFRVELPLALPVIMGGLRVATVSTVALTTIGSLVAFGGLGNLINAGVRDGFRAQLLAASVLCVILALVLDVVIVVVQQLLTPWNRRAAGAAT